LLFLHFLLIKYKKSIEGFKTSLLKGPPVHFPIISGFFVALRQFLDTINRKQSLGLLTENTEKTNLKIRGAEINQK
jgi:hypothetical protein